MDSVVVLLRVRNKPHINSFQKKKGLIFFSLVIVKIFVKDKALICFVMAPEFHAFMTSYDAQSESETIHSI